MQLYYCSLWYFCVAPVEESSCDDEVQVTQEVHVVASYTTYVVTMWNYEIRLGWRVNIAFSLNLFHFHKHIHFLLLVEGFAPSWLLWWIHHQGIDTKPAPWIKHTLWCLGEWWTPANTCQSSDVCLSTWSETATPCLAPSIKTGLQYPTVLLMTGTTHLCILVPIWAVTDCKLDFTCYLLYNAPFRLVCTTS